MATAAQDTRAKELLRSIIQAIQPLLPIQPAPGADPITLLDAAKVSKVTDALAASEDATAAEAKKV